VLEPVFFALRDAPIVRTQSSLLDRYCGNAQGSHRIPVHTVQALKADQKIAGQGVCVARGGQALSILQVQHRLSVHTHKRFAVDV